MWSVVAAPASMVTRKKGTTPPGVAVDPPRCNGGDTSILGAHSDAVSEARFPATAARRRGGPGDGATIAERVRSGVTHEDASCFVIECCSSTPPFAARVARVIVAGDAGGA